MGKRKDDPFGLRHQCKCNECHADMWANAVPFGEPSALLITGVCPECYATRICVDSMEVRDVRPAARYLADFFGSVAEIDNAQTQH